MTREAMERGPARRAEQAMQAAAIRFALERAGQDVDPVQAYGCVDWFRYDVPSPPQEGETAPLSAAPPCDAGSRGKSSAH